MRVCVCGRGYFLWLIFVFKVLLPQRTDTNKDNRIVWKIRNATRALSKYRWRDSMKRKVTQLMNGLDRNREIRHMLRWKSRKSLTDCVCFQEPTATAVVFGCVRRFWARPPSYKTSRSAKLFAWATRETIGKILVNYKRDRNDRRT